MTQVTFAQDEAAEVPTVWDKLGFAKAKKKREERRDARLNKDGCSPEKEKKPKLIKIADKKNAESDNPLLAIAAKAKQDADLAPQKLKAIKYLATLGCGCNADIEDAVLAGLDDCTAAVRAASVRLVLSGANKTDICDTCENGRKRRFKKKRVLCGKCKGRGCLGCRHKGSVEVQTVETMPTNAGSCGCDACCEHVQSCNVCGTCCSEKVKAKLDKMAFGQDPTGCYHEPDASIRALAEQALNACPETPILTYDDPDPKPPVKVNSGGGGVKPERGGIQGEQGDSVIDESANMSYFRSQPVSHQSQNHYIFSETDRKNMIRGTIVGKSQGSISIRFADSYLLPEGTQLYIATDKGTEATLEVVSSQTGTAIMRPLDASGQQVKIGANAWVGILNN